MNDPLIAGADPAQDIKPTAYLEDRIVQRLFLTDARVGESFPLVAQAKVVSISSHDGENGMPVFSVTLELDGISIERTPQFDGTKVYPSMMGG